MVKSGTSLGSLSTRTNKNNQNQMKSCTKEATVICRLPRCSSSTIIQHDFTVLIKQITSLPIVMCGHEQVFISKSMGCNASDINSRKNCEWTGQLRDGFNSLLQYWSAPYSNYCFFLICSLMCIWWCNGSIHFILSSALLKSPCRKKKRVERR